MNLNDMLDSRYLKQSDVPEPVLVTIESLKKVNLARDDEAPKYKWAIKFHEFAKPLAANATNLKRVAAAHGDQDIEFAWIGKQMTLYVDENIEFGGDIVGGLRLKGLPRAKLPRAKPNPRPTRRDDEEELNRKLAAAAADDDV